MKHTSRRSPVLAYSTPAINGSVAYTSAELRKKLADLRSQLRAAEWEWDRSPTKIHAMFCRGLREAVSAIEDKLSECSPV